MDKNTFTVNINKTYYVLFKHIKNLLLEIILNNIEKIRTVTVV